MKENIETTVVRDSNAPGTTVETGKDGLLALTRRGFLLSAAAIALLPRDARASALVVASEDNYPPYAFNQRGRRRGFDVEKVEAVLGSLHYRAVHRGMLRPALVAALDEGKVDMAFPFAGSPERFEKYHMVGPIHSSQTVFAVRTGEPEPTTIEALKGHRVGVIDGFRYTPEFDAAQGFDRLMSSNMTVALRRLAGGRVDVVIGDRASLEYLVKADGLGRKIRVTGHVLAEAPRYCAFPKSRTALATAFKEALARLETEGTFSALNVKFFGEGLAGK